MKSGALIRRMVAILAVPFMGSDLGRADAATITVTSTADSDPSICTLRSAIIAANNNVAFNGCAAGEPGLDTITFALPRRCLFDLCTIDLTSPLPSATEDLALDGGFYRPTISRVVVNEFPVFSLGSIITADIRNVTISGGSTTFSGGAIRMIYDGTNLTVTNVTFTSNHATGTGRGGALSAWGPTQTLTVIDCMFGNNGAPRGGAIECQGASVNVSGSTFSGNFASGDGGAIYAAGGQGGQSPYCNLTVGTSTFDGNTAGIGPITGPSSGSGGAISAFSPAATIIDSTFTNNVAYGASGDGGALAFRVDNQDPGSSMLTNVTLSGNVAKRNGGGIASDGGTEINNLTVTNNSADSDKDGDGKGGGIYLRSGSVDFRVRNSIIAANFSSPGLTGTSPDCSGTFISRGYNLLGSTDGCGGFGSEDGDRVGGGTTPIDPMLGPLADNGGPTRTHALLSGSPAIDPRHTQKQEIEVVCPETDQRGVTRPLDGDGDGTATCDVGAYEAAGVPPGSSTTTSTTATTTTDVSSPPTTSTTVGSSTPVGCLLSQLPPDSLVGVECAIGMVRSTLSGPLEASCTCKRCSIRPRLDRVADLVMQTEAAVGVKQCKRKLGKARRVAKSLNVKVASLMQRGCLAPADRATKLETEVADLASRVKAVFKSPFCAAN